MEIKNRKGARKRDEVPNEVITLLNTGKISTVNLVESLVVDQEELLKNVLMDLGAENYIEACLININELDKKTSVKCILTIGKTLLSETTNNNDTKLFEKLSKHSSDTVRAWATYFIGVNNNLSIKEKLELIRPFAQDDHFGVREMAWMALRESISNNLEESIAIMSLWTKEENFYLRRFASEATRPCGVWTKHINEIKENPTLGLAILEPLKSDKEKYVQNSVANWLNDESKYNPKWVKKVCKNWIENSPTKETEKIVKRGLRTLNSKK